MRGHLIDMEDVTWELVTAAAAVSGVSRAEWVRWAIANQLALDGVPRSTDPPTPTAAQRLAKRQKAKARVVVPPGGAIPVVTQTRCDHPRERRKVLAYGTFCDACGGKVR